MKHHPEHGTILDADDMAALLGRTPDEITAAIREHGTLPDAWVEHGRSRADVAREATGRDDMAGALEFWRAQRKENP